MLDDACLRAIQYWQGLGKPVCIDLDDSYPMLPVSNPAYEFWQEQHRDSLRTLVDGITMSNGLIAPNKNLLVDFNSLTGCRGYYIQNYAERSWWENLPDKYDLRHEKNISDDKIIIGWGGSISHYDSFHGSGVFKALERLCRIYPQVTMMICGNDSRLYDQLSIPKSQKLQQPGVPPSEWPKIVKMFDIGIAPLFWDYDQRRSWIKGIEYLMAGVPWIGTDGGENGTYSDLRGSGELIHNGEMNWFNALEKMVKELDQYRVVSESRIELAQKRFIADYNTNVLVDTYKQIVSDFKQDKQGVLPGVYKL